MDGQPVLVGRESERAALRAAIDGAAIGEPGLVLVHGEAGIGKTSVVREAADIVRLGGGQVLMGQCLRFGADVTSYVPFTQAITHWLRTSDSDIRARLAPHGTVDDVVPALLDTEAGVALLQIGTFIEALQAETPTVLILDDLQWSDPSSLDALSYIVAGFGRGQRLAVLGTYRDTDLGEGHRLHGWLADVSRLPAVTKLPLGRLDVLAVEEMVRTRAGPQSRSGLAADVHRRSGGNPYLAYLLISDPDVASGVAPLGGRLVEALSASWHRLSPHARRVTQLLAIAGTPVAFLVLQGLAARHGVPPEETGRAVAEATGQGITIETDSGAIWFRHPLLAEVIASTLKGWEVADVHQEVAALWLAADGVDERDRANALSLHFVAAGDHDQGFSWSLRAADEAEAVRAWEEQASHLATAVALREGLSDEVARQVDPVDLLMRAARAFEAAGDDRGAVMHYESALARVDRSNDPLLASRILLELHLLRDMAGLGSGSLSLSEPNEVLALTERSPDSPERALAFAHLAFAEVFSGVEGAREHAENAVRLAETVGTARAVVWAFGTRGQTQWGTDAGIADSQRAFTVAHGTDDPQLQCRSAFFLSNSYESAGRYAEAAETTVQAYQALRDVGQFDYAAAVGAVAARWSFTLGRWQPMRPMVRELLTLARSDNSAAISRCAAALLTAHEGNVTAAGLHLERAEELMPHAAPVGDPLADTQIQVDIAIGHSPRALDRISAHMAEALEINPIAADEWLQLASRAALHTCELSADDGVRMAALRTLEQIEATRGTTPTPFDPAGPRDVVHPALGALHAAQRAELNGSGAEAAALWEAACRATEKADMRYEHARALYRLGYHVLTHQGDRLQAATSLAAARHIAGDLGARPLTASVDALAQQTHLNLPATEPEQSRASSLGLLDGAHLTTREREVLAGLLAGETYGQIAHRLFISAKTVSSHVSTILRKTGTTSRIELSLLAQRDSRSP